MSTVKSWTVAHLYITHCIFDTVDHALQSSSDMHSSAHAKTESRITVRNLQSSVTSWSGSIVFREQTESEFKQVLIVLISLGKEWKYMH